MFQELLIAVRWRKSDGPTADLPQLSDAQRAAAKGWGIAVLATWVTKLLSFAGLVTYYFWSSRPNMNVAMGLFVATVISARVAEIVCGHSFLAATGIASRPSVWRSLCFEIALWLVATYVLFSS